MVESSEGRRYKKTWDWIGVYEMHGIPADSGGSAYTARIMTERTVASPSAESFAGQPSLACAQHPATSIQQPVTSIQYRLPFSNVGKRRI